MWDFYLQGIRLEFFVDIIVVSQNSNESHLRDHFDIVIKILMKLENTS